MPPRFTSREPAGPAFIRCLPMWPNCFTSDRPIPSRRPSTWSKKTAGGKSAERLTGFANTFSPKACLTPLLQPYRVGKTDPGRYPCLLPPVSHAL
ncbi:hypothetical protein DESC_780080 [Desulfosarcina cetonica]|nr:hypothetical protein DESC_780080 [Desulfosarcina cetonica]